MTFTGVRTGKEPSKTTHESHAVDVGRYVVVSAEEVYTDTTSYGGRRPIGEDVPVLATHPNGDRCHD